MPEWDLTDLYPSPDGQELAGDIESARKTSKSFAKRYQGKLADLGGDKLAKAIGDYEKIDEVLSRIMSYAS
ncbi:MAG: oligoendopeptidase F, partial [Alphaproteobacteria bacterium]